MKSMRDIMRSYAVFNSEGRHVNGSDKQSNHNYGDAYESLFFSYVDKEVKVTDHRTEMLPERISGRDDVKLVMEVGVADGSCLLAWRDIFPNATVVGMDVHPSDRAHGDRIEFHIGDQRSLEDCRSAAAGRQFDMIVEDATHKLDNTLLTLLYLWPFVKPGGIYVVEEFDNVGALRTNIKELWPNAEIVDTKGPFGGVEPLVVLRKPRN